MRKIAFLLIGFVALYLLLVGNTTATFESPISPLNTPAPPITVIEEVDRQIIPKTGPVEAQPVKAQSSTRRYPVSCTTETGDDRPFVCRRIK